MLKQLQTPRFVLVLSLIAFATVSRLLPHPPNFTALGAMALFGGAMLGNRVLALTVPLVAMLLSDLFLGLDVHTFAGVYLSFVLIAAMGNLLKRNSGFGRITLIATAASVLFFLVTNAWDWYANPMYPQSAGGLVAAYAAGLAFYSQDVFGNFFLNTLMSNIVFSWVLFGAVKLVASIDPRFALKPIPVRSERNTPLDEHLTR